MTTKIRYRGKKWGLVDENHTIILDYIYDSIKTTDYNLLIVEFKQKYGLVNRQGVFITPMIYDYMNVIDEKLIWVRINRNFGLINHQGEILLDVIYDDIYYIAYQQNRSSSLLIKKDKLRGLADNTGKIFIPIMYDCSPIDCLEEIGLIKITMDNPHGWYGYGRSGYIDANNEVVIDIKYQVISYINKEYFVAGFEKDKQGVIDRNQNIIIEFKYQDIHFNYQNHRHLFFAKQNDYWALFHFQKHFCFKSMKYRYDKQITDFIYQDWRFLDSGLIYVVKNKQVGLIDEFGTVVLPIIYEYINHLQLERTGFALIRNNGLYGMIDYLANVIVPTIYTELYPISYGLIRMKTQGKYGFLDSQGRMILDAKFDHAYNCRDNMIAVCINHKWAFFNSQGEMVIDFIYDSVESFFHGVATVIKNNQRLFIDKNGNEISQEEYRAIRLTKK